MNDTAPIKSPPTLDSKAVDLITTDFRKMYDVYLFQLAERSSALRYYIAVLSAPFLIISGAGVLAGLGSDPAKAANFLELISRIPTFLFLPFFLCGGIGILIFRMFWAAHCEVYKVTRYMNNFRRLYRSYFVNQFSDLGWELYVESDALNPLPGKLISWTTSILLSMLIVNTGYVILGYYLFREFHNILEYWIFLLIIAVMCISFHAYIYHSCKSSRGKDEPESIQSKKKKS